MKERVILIINIITIVLIDDIDILYPHDGIFYSYLLQILPQVKVLSTW